MRSFSIGPAGLTGMAHTDRLDGTVARMRGKAREFLCIALFLPLVVCGAASANDRRDVHLVAERYLRAITLGDGKTACSLLSRRGLSDAGYGSPAACVKSYAGSDPHKPYAVHNITLRAHHTTTAFLEIGKGRGSNSGTIVLRRYGRRWLIDVG